jgi:DNA-binding transcriptional LysR family regulator
MDIDQLKTLVQVVEWKSYSKAALNLHISQPTVSARIRILEEELGQRLLYRHGKQIQLTAVGEYFYGYAKNVVANSDEMIKTLQEFSSFSVLSIGATPFCAGYLLSDIIPELQKHPKYDPVNIRTVSQPSQLIELFSKGILDVAMVSAGNLSNVQHVEMLWKEPTVLVASPHHPLSKSGSIKASDVARHSLAMLSPEHDVNHYSHQLIELFKKEDLEIKPRIIIDNLEMAKHLVLQGNMISFLPLLSVEKEIEKKELVALPDQLSDYISRNIYLIYRSNIEHPLFKHLRMLLLESAERRKQKLNDTCQLTPKTKPL